MKQRKAKKGISNKELNRRLFRRTLVLLGVLGVLGFVPMVLKLVQLQIVQHETWSQKAVNQQTVDTAVNAQRGGIYDNEGESLAVSATAYNLILSPYQVIASVDEDDYESEGLYQAAIQAKRQLVVDGMVELLGADPDRMWKRIERTDSQYEVLAYEMEEDEVEIAVQINGKTRAVISIPKDIAKEEALAKGKEALGDKLTGNVIKEIYVPGKIINIVAK